MVDLVFPEAGLSGSVANQLFLDYCQQSTCTSISISIATFSALVRDAGPFCSLIHRVVLHLRRRGMHILAVAHMSRTQV